MKKGKLPDYFDLDIRVLELHYKLENVLLRERLKTVGDLMLDCGGDFTRYRGLGPLWAGILSKQLKELGIDSDSYYQKSIHSLHLPRSVTKAFIAAGILEISQLKKIRITRIYKALQYNYQKTEEIVRLLNGLGIRLMPSHNPLLFETKLSKRAVNIFTGAGIYQVSQLTRMSKKDLQNMRAVGRNIVAEVLLYYPEIENNR